MHDSAEKTILERKQLRLRWRHFLYGKAMKLIANPLHFFLRRLHNYSVLMNDDTTLILRKTFVGNKCEYA